jgi:hypothetical protein
LGDPNAGIETFRMPIRRNRRRNFMLRLREIADDIEVELNKIDGKVARAETRKKSVRRKAA